MAPVDLKVGLSRFPWGAARGQAIDGKVHRVVHVASAAIKLLNVCAAKRANVDRKELRIPSDIRRSTEAIGVRDIRRGGLHCAATVEKREEERRVTSSFVI